jgi:hypothetical protein
MHGSNFFLDFLKNICSDPCAGLGHSIYKAGVDASNRYWELNPHQKYYFSFNIIIIIIFFKSYPLTINLFSYFSTLLLQLFNFHTLSILTLLLFFSLNSSKKQPSYLPTSFESFLSL